MPPRCNKMPLSKRAIAVTGACLACLSHSLLAESIEQNDAALFELPLSSLLSLEISAASKSPEPLNWAAGSASVLTREDIIRYGALNLRDAIGRLPGTLLLNDGNFQSDNLGLRGDDLNFNNHLLLLIDGRPFRSTSAASDAQRRLFTSFPIALVERIELIRGPGSALYGTGAYTGVINIVTREADDNQQELSLGVGSNSAQWANLSHFYTDGEQLSLAMSLQSWDDAGWTASLQDQSDSSVNRELGEHYSTLTARLNFQDTQALLYTANRHSDTLGQGAVLGSSSLEDKHIYLSLSSPWQLNDDWQARFSSSWLGLRVNDKQFVDDEYLLELDLVGHISSSSEALLGVSSLKSQLDSKDPLISDYALDTHTIYGQWTEKLSETTQLVLGFQGNHTEGKAGAVVPRFALNHQFNQRWGFKALYSEAYRSPNAVETGIVIPNTLTGNKDIVPETVETSELELYFHNPHFFASATLFHSKQKGLITPVFNPGLMAAEYQNNDKRTFWGSELMFKHEVSDSFSWQGSISSQTNTEKGEQNIDEVTTLPNLVAKLGVSYTASAWSLGIWDTFVSDYRSNEDFDANKTKVNPKAESYHYATAKLTWTPQARTSGPFESFQTALFVRNLFDQTIYQNSLSSASSINTFPAETDRAFYISFELAL